MSGLEELKQDLAKLLSQDAPPPKENDPQSSKKGVMRSIYPEICGLLEKGWRAKDIVKWMEQYGVKMSVGTFRVYLNQLDEENGKSRRSEIEIAPPVSGQLFVEPQGKPAQAKQESKSTARPVSTKKIEEKPIPEITTQQEDNDVDIAAALESVKMPRVGEKGFIELGSPEKKK